MQEEFYTMAAVNRMLRDMIAIVVLVLSPFKFL